MALATGDHMTITNISLFDVENTDETPKVRDMTIASVSTTEVNEFCQRYHYTATGGNMTWRYGLYHGAVLYGVVAYNLPTRDTCESILGPDHFDKIWHMGRLALAETSPRNSESRLIAGSLKLIGREYPHIWAVVTYAAPDAGHIGYVYQATNAIYTGTGGRVRKNTGYIDPTGRMRSSVLGGQYVGPKRAADLGWTPYAGTPKHRYVYILGNKRERKQRLALLQLPTLPYPKAAP